MLPDFVSAYCEIYSDTYTPQHFYAQCSLAHNLFFSRALKPKPRVTEVYDCFVHAVYSLGTTVPSAQQVFNECLLH